MTAPQGSPAYQTGVQEENGAPGAESLSRACLDAREVDHIRTGAIQPRERWL
jgi:hypothetical protein